MVRAYRRDQFIVIEGEVVETGVGFSLTYDYDHFRELFARKSKEERALQKKYNQDEKEKKKQQKAADKKADSTAAPVQPASQPPQKQTLN